MSGATIRDSTSRYARRPPRCERAVESADITAAVRTMYKRVGIDPTKTRPSSEALLRRVRKGDELPRINSLVDIINWCSLESQLPFGLYDLDRIHGAGRRCASARPGEEYAGIRKDVVHVEGRLTLADDAGPFGNPTSDSARTMVTPATTRALVVIFAPVSVPGRVGRARDARRPKQRIEQSLHVRPVLQPTPCRYRRHTGRSNPMSVGVIIVAAGRGAANGRRDRRSSCSISAGASMLRRSVDAFDAIRPSPSSWSCCRRSW